MPRECQSAILSMRGTLGRMRRAIAVGLDRSMMQALCYARGMPKIEEKESKDGYTVQIEATQRGKESADM